MMKRRLPFFAAITFLAAAACNAILGIEELPKATDATGDATPSEGGTTQESGTTDATTDAPVQPGPCGSPTAPDPCTIVIQQDAGSVYPTWPITSDLNIRGQGGTSFPSLKPNYVDAGNGAVVETHTALTWRTSYAAGGATGLDASASVCPAGYRVPTFIELASTQYRAFEVSDASATPPATCAPPVFDQGQLGNVWTSTPTPFVAGETAGNFYFMDEVGCGFASNPPSDAFNVRCVKGTPQHATFIVSRAKDTVVAVDTSLEWERTGALVSDFVSAKAHCDGKGWRVPVIQELYSILDTRTALLFDPVLFVEPTGGDAGKPRAIVSQTTFATSGDRGPVYEAVLLNGPPRGVKDGFYHERDNTTLLVRCVTPYVPPDK